MCIFQDPRKNQIGPRKPMHLVGNSFFMVDARTGRGQEDSYFSTLSVIVLVERESGMPGQPPLRT